jgi:hypothetical protein
MAWLEQEESGRYHVAFRFGTSKFKRSPKTTNETEAQTRLVRLEENTRLLESGRMTMPDGTDAATFLLASRMHSCRPTPNAANKSSRRWPNAA